MTIYVHAGIGNRGQYSREEIMEITYRVLAEHQHPGHSPQGGYSGKKRPDLLAISTMDRTYPVELKNPLSALTLSNMASGIEFEDHIGAILTQHATPGEVVVIEETLDADGNRTEDGKAAKEEATWAAYLDPTVRLIFNARLAKRFSELVSAHFGRTINDPDRVSEPDAIELGPLMPNGLRAMRFVDVKWHKTASGDSAVKEYPASPLAEPFYGAGATISLPGQLQLDDWMQLAHYYRHGKSLGLCDDDASLWGAVIGKEEVLVWARLDVARFLKHDPKTGKRRKQSPLEIYDRAFANCLDVIDNAIARDLDPTVPALTYPEWCDDVAGSEWAQVCMEELRAHGDGGHITLLAGVTTDKAAALYEIGVTSIGDLARLDPTHLVDGIKDLGTLIEKARVTLSGAPALAGPGLDVPRADIEVDFDYEADHVLYQRGVRVTDHTGEVPVTTMEWFDDFTGTEDGERDVFVAMWAKFGQLAADAAQRGQSIAFYHYSHYERTNDVRLATKYAGAPGVPSVEDVTSFYACENVVDLYPLLKAGIVWPTKSHSIKDLAKHAGFAWPEEGQNGGESMVWYRLTVAGGETAEENFHRLRDYNAADTEAQLVLREWVCDQLATMPLAAQVPAPA